MPKSNQFAYLVAARSPCGPMTPPRPQGSILRAPWARKLLLVAAAFAATASFATAAHLEDLHGAASAGLKDAGAPASGSDPMIPAVSLGDLKLRIPLVYGLPRPRDLKNVKDVALPWIGLAFWMPDLAAPKDDVFFKPFYFERERPASNYLVQINTMSRTKEYEKRGMPKPAVQVQNLQNFLETFDVVEDHGIMRLVPAAERRLPMATWFDLSDDNTTYKLSCFLEGEVVNPLCQVNMALDDWDLLVSFRIPAHARYDVRNVAAGLRTLLTRWVDRT